MKKAGNRKYFSVFLIVFFLILMLDQWTKSLAVQFLRDGRSFSYLGGFVQIFYSQNTGAFLGLGNDLGAQSRFILFTIGVFVILTFVFWMLWTKRMPLIDQISYVLIASGGVGNLIDRIQQSYVVDFLYMQLGPLHTGVFNIADIAITAGVLTLFFRGFSPKRAKKS